MDRGIYAKAADLVAHERVREAGESPRAAYFEVAGESGTHHVRLMSDHSFNCTCTWGSLKGATNGALCSHVVAAILSLAQLRRTSDGAGQDN